MALANIPSAADSTVSLGSLRVGDTILFRGRGAVRNAVLDHVLTVTKPFAYFRSWIQNGEEADAIQVLMRSLQSEFMLQSRSVRLGKALAPLDVDSEPKTDAGDGPEGAVVQAEFLAFSKATLILDSETLPVLNGSWRVFTEGFVFKSPHMNPILVSFQRNVKSLQILPSQHEELVLLKMDLKEDERSHMTPLSEALPFAFRSRSLYIPLLSGSRFQEDVLRVLTVWKATAATLNIPIYRPSDLSEKFEGNTPRDGELASFDVPVCVKATCDLLVQKRHFAGQDAHTIGAFFPQDFIPKDPNASTTLSKPNAGNLSKLCVPITVLLGIPGSDVMTISRSICEISASSFEWIHVEIDLRDMEASKQSCLEASGCLEISSRLKKALDRAQATAQSMRLHPRIMLAIVGYVDTLTVASAIKRTSREASIQSKISTIITCVSATNVYLPDPLTTQAPFPKVFDQMIAGFATHLVLTNSADVTSPLLQRLRFRMDQVNSFADVLVLSHDVFEGPLTPLLAVDRFESAYYKQYRDVHFCDWENATATSSEALSSVGFVAELEAEYSPVTFRFEITPGMDRSKFAYLVMKALTPFATMTNSMDKIYPIETSPNTTSKGIRIAQSIAVEKVRQASGASTPLSTVELAFLGRSCWCVEGRVVFEDDPSSVYDYRSSGAFARLWLAAHDGKDKAPPSLELKITGQGLNAGKLRELLLNCYAHAEMSPHQVRSKATISLEEKREVQRQHAMDPLPDGYLFDGSTYVDFFGGRYEFHPNIARFIDEHISAANDDRKATNLKATEERESQQAFVRQLL
ncbi:hypothetical protein BBJ28_00011089 [Nothophytophthora sp. Chile5]|nr:hypothetical protein BBJ28_00011089 [Nothophytophthora sp. Chile5]